MRSNSQIPSHCLWEQRKILEVKENEELNFSKSSKILLYSLKWLWENLNGQFCVEASTQSIILVFFTFSKWKSSSLLQPILQDAWFICSFFNECIICCYVYDTIFGTIGRNKNDTTWLFYTQSSCYFRIWNFLWEKVFVSLSMSHCAIIIGLWYEIIIFAMKLRVGGLQCIKM